jgi:hypothetical protein
MQPLYLARIEDLRHGDLVKVDCAATGVIEQLWHRSQEVEPRDTGA